MNKPCPSILKKNRADGFTLIELLVVTAVAAILACLLLPALAGTKPNSQAFQCMENQRQLILAWQMYAEDNADLLPPNDYPFQTGYAFALPTTQAKEKNWVVGTMANAFDAVDAPGKTGISELLDPNTLLSTYITNKADYHCPSDKYIDTFQGNIGHVRSYSMNSAVGTVWNTFYQSSAPLIGTAVQGGWLPGISFNSSQTIWLTYGKISSFTRPGPANTFVTMDENPITINDGAIEISALATVGHTYLIGFPAGNHNGAAGISFADGHVIVHKWLDSRTYNPPISLHGGGNPGAGGGSINESLQGGDDKDCFYLAPITSALR